MHERSSDLLLHRSLKFVASPIHKKIAHICIRPVERLRLNFFSSRHRTLEQLSASLTSKTRNIHAVLVGVVFGHTLAPHVAGVKSKRRRGAVEYQGKVSFSVTHPVLRLKLTKLCESARWQYTWASKDETNKSMRMSAPTVHVSMIWCLMWDRRIPLESSAGEPLNVHVQRSVWRHLTGRARMCAQDWLTECEWSNECMIFTVWESKKNPAKILYKTYTPEVWCGMSAWF